MNSKVKPFAYVLLTVFIFTLEPFSVNAQGYQQAGSWAVGVVVHDGFMLSNGQKVLWKDVYNISVMLKLPLINRTDKTVMCVESLMVGNGSIIQASVSLYPNSSYWTVCGMYISNPESYPQEYVLEQHFGNIEAGSLISLSFIKTDKGWAYSVIDYNNSKIFKAFLPVKGQPVDGVQYVMAFESYSYNSSVFKNMGKAVFYGIFANGFRIIKGADVYTTWSESLTPLFIVGGQNPPSFVEIYTENGSYIVTYLSSWTGYREGGSGYYYLFALGLAAAAFINVIYLALAIKKLRKKRIKLKQNLSCYKSYR